MPLYNRLKIFCSRNPLYQLVTKEIWHSLAAINPLQHLARPKSMNCSAAPVARQPRQELKATSKRCDRIFLDTLRGTNSPPAAVTSATRRPALDTTTRTMSGLGKNSGDLNGTSNSAAVIECVQRRSSRHGSGTAPNRRTRWKIIRLYAPSRPSAVGKLDVTNRPEGPVFWLLRHVFHAVPLQHPSCKLPALQRQRLPLALASPLRREGTSSIDVSNHERTPNNSSRQAHLPSKG